MRRKAERAGASAVSSTALPGSTRFVVSSRSAKPPCQERSQRSHSRLSAKMASDGHDGVGGEEFQKIAPGQIRV